MKQSGFTLIELLVVTAIIGVLAALAVPQYSLFKDNALNATAAADARNIAPAAELVAAKGGLADAITLAGSGGPIAELPGAATSPGTFGVVSVDPNQYSIETYHLSGSLCYQMDSSSQSGMVVLDRNHPDCPL